MYDFCSLAIKIKLLINYAKIKAEKVRNSIIVTYSKILNYWNNSEEYLTYNSATSAQTSNIEKYNRAGIDLPTSAPPSSKL